MAAVPQFDYYVVSRVLGEGGMGIVYLAIDRRTDLPVAIKLMSKRMHDPEVQFRFMRENDILSSLNHRNIVRCYEITRARDGTPCIVMEYLRGSDFRAFEGRPYPELIPLMIQTLMGMEYLRQQKIVHRDLSSNNLLVILENEKRFVKILDFGIAKVLHETPLDSEMNTQTGQFLGKFGYAAPELFFSTGADWRSDVYSLGVVFFRLLMKHAPLRVEKTGNFYEWMMAHQAPFEPSFVVPPGNPPLPDNLQDVLRLMLARDPAARPQSYRLIIDWLDAIQQRAFELGLEPDPTEVTSLPQPVVDRSSSRPSDGAAALAHPSAEVRATPSDSRPQGHAPSGSAPELRLRTPSGPPPPPSTPSPGPRRGGTGDVAEWHNLPTTPERGALGSSGDSSEDRTARLEDLLQQASAPPPAPAPPIKAAAPRPPPSPPEPVAPADSFPRRQPTYAPRRPTTTGAVAGRNRFIDVNASMGLSTSSSQPLPAVAEATGPSRLRVALIVLGILLLFGGILYGVVMLMRAATAPVRPRAALSSPTRTAGVGLRFEVARDGGSDG